MNDRRAPGTPLWIADEAEARGVAEPAANVIDRHLPSAIRDPDARDAFAAALTLVRYLWRQIRLRAELRKTARDAGGLDAAEPEQPAP